MLPSKRKDTYSFTECSSKRRISNRDITMEDDDMSSPIPSPTSSNNSFMDIEQCITNEQEYIVFCIDLDEEINSTFKQTVPRLDHIKKALSLFVRSKLRLDPNTKFAICILRVSAIWFMDFTSEFNEIKSKLNSLKHGGKFTAFDMTTLFDTLENIFKQIVESKQSARLLQNSSTPSTPIPMNWNLRVIFIYSRSSIIPQYLGGNSSLESLKKNSNFSFESIYMYHIYHADHGKIVESIGQATKNISKISDQSSIRKFYYCFLGILFVPPSQRPLTPKYQRFPVGLINENLERLGPCGKNLNVKPTTTTFSPHLVQIPHVPGHQLHAPFIFQIQTHHHHPNQQQQQQQQPVPAIVVPLIHPQQPLPHNNQQQQQQQQQPPQIPPQQQQPPQNIQPIQPAAPQQAPPQQQNQAQVEQPAQQPIENPIQPQDVVEQPPQEANDPPVDININNNNNNDNNDVNNNNNNTTNNNNNENNNTTINSNNIENPEPVQQQPTQPQQQQPPVQQQPAQQQQQQQPNPPQPTAVLQQPQPVQAIPLQAVQPQQAPLPHQIPLPVPHQPNNIFPLVYYPFFIQNPNANPQQPENIVIDPLQIYNPYAFLQIQGQPPNVAAIPQQQQQQQLLQKINNKPVPNLRSSVDEETNAIPSLGSMLKPYVNNTQFSDVVFVVGKTEDCPGELIYGHKVILSARSKYFKALFTNGMRESGSKGEIVVPGVSKDVFLALLCYLYTDDLTPVDGTSSAAISLTPTKSTTTTTTSTSKSNNNNSVGNSTSTSPPAHGFSSSLLTELLILANQYMLDGLKIKCCELIGDTLSVNNLVSLMNLASIHEATELKNACILYFYSNLPIILRDCPFENEGAGNEGSEALGFLIVDYFSKVSKLSSTDGKSDESNPELSAKNFDELVSLF